MFDLNQSFHQKNVVINAISESSPFIQLHQRLAWSNLYQKIEYIGIDKEIWEHKSKDSFMKQFWITGMTRGKNEQ